MQTHHSFVRFTILSKFKHTFKREREALWCLLPEPVYISERRAGFISCQESVKMRRQQFCIITIIAWFFLMIATTTAGTSSTALTPPTTITARTSTMTATSAAVTSNGKNGNDKTKQEGEDCKAAPAASSSPSRLDFLDDLREKYARHQPFFMQAVEEMALSLQDLFQDSTPLGDYYRRAFLTLAEPERTISFRVPWTDDSGNLHFNRGWRVEFSRYEEPTKQTKKICRHWKSTSVKDTILSSFYSCKKSSPNVSPLLVLLIVLSPHYAQQCARTIQRWSSFPSHC
jgi:hypothetical protein